MMQVLSAFYALALATTVGAFGGLHSASDGLLQIHPSFASDKVTLFPGLHPDHNKSDLHHLKPHLSRELYYSQEGHRPAMHGAKHADFKANYTLPTVVLEHSSHVKSVQCSAHSMLICFQTQQAFETVKSWESLKAFHLVTYHVGCGDESSGKRSYFEASHPVLLVDSRCISVSTVPVEQRDVVDSGDISWGTYTSPHEQKRTATKGHIRMINSAGDSSDRPYPDAATVDLDTNLAAFKYFFNDTRSNITLTNATVDDIGFASRNGTLSRRVSRHRRQNGGPIVVSDGGNDEPEKSTWEELQEFGTKVKNFFKESWERVKKVGIFLGKVTRVGFDLARVPFGHQFERSYNEDFKINARLQGKAETKAPQILGHENGYNLGDTGGVFSPEATIQCAKCSMTADFNVNGQLAFSRDGITAGTATFHNLEPITIDAIFGITAKGKYEKTWDKKIPIKKQPTPIDIPGLITIGPMIKVNAAFTVTLEGEAEVVVGGSYSMAKGKATIDLVHQSQTGYSGLEQKFTPTFEFNGTMTATGEFGLPLTAEVGIDLLDSKWKKTGGMTVSPAVYVKSILTTKDDGGNCGNGMELRAGVKSPVVFSVFDLYTSKEYLADPLYEHGLACFTKKGYEPNKVGPANGIIVEVIDKFKGQVKDGDITKNVPPLDDVTAKFPKVTSKGNAGYRIVMTAEQDGIVVSGTDGNIYLAATKADYDFSAPWATTNTKQDILNADTFGRLIAFQAQRNLNARPINLSVLDLFVANETVMPKGAMMAGFAELEDPNHQKRIGPYGVVVNNPVPSLFNGMKMLIYVPTVCLGPDGLRLLGTQYTITDRKQKSGSGKGDYIVEDPVGYQDIRGSKLTPYQWLEKGLDPLGYDVANCRTIQLTRGN